MGMFLQGFRCIHYAIDPQISTANPYAAFVKLKYQQAVGNSFAEKIKNIGILSALSGDG